MIEFGLTRGADPPCDVIVKIWLGDRLLACNADPERAGLETQERTVKLVDTRITPEREERGDPGIGVEQPPDSIRWQFKVVVRSQMFEELNEDSPAN